MKKDLGEFFDSVWQAYRDLIDHDLMHHKDLFSTLVSEIKARFSHPISFLDLACGDADPARMVLKQAKVKEYTGVDLAPGVLKKAEELLRPFSLPLRLHIGDFLEFLSLDNKLFDLILVSFSIHHFPTEKKVEFFQKAHNRLAPGGILVFIDGIRLPRQTRMQWLKQCFDYMQNRSMGKCPETFRVVWDHMNLCDYPEDSCTYEQMGSAAGFGESRMVHHDPASTFGLYLAGKPNKQPN